MWTFESTLRLAIRLGLSIEQYEDMTPRQLYIMADETYKHSKLESEAKMQEIYLTAKLTASFVWAQQIPTFEQVFTSGEKGNADVMSDEDMYKVAAMLNTRFGEIESEEE